MGFRAGVLKEAASVLSLVGALIVATRSMHKVGEGFTLIWHIQEVIAVVWAFALVFFGIFLTQTIVIGFLTRKTTPPKLWSRSLGAVFGLVEGALSLSLLLILLNLYDAPSQQARRQSFLYDPLSDFAPQVFDAANGVFSGSTSFSDELKKSFQQHRSHPLDRDPVPSND